MLFIQTGFTVDKNFDWREKIASPPTENRIYFLSYGVYGVVTPVGY